MPVDLSAMYSQSNPFIAQDAQKQFDLSQLKGQADLQSILGQETRAQQMQPLDMAQRQASTRSTNAASLIQENAEASRPPVADRLAAVMKEQHAKMSDLDRAKFDGDMYQAGQLAAVAKSNGGVLPLALQGQLPEGYTQYFKDPASVATFNKMFQAYHENHPKTIEARAKQDAAYKQAIGVAQIGADSRVQAAQIRAAKALQAAKNMSPDQAMVHFNNLAMNEADPELKQRYQAEADRYELMKYRAIQAAAAARQENTTDISKATNGRVPTIKNPPLAPTPRQEGGWKPPAGWSTN